MSLKVFLYGKGEKPGVKEAAADLEGWFRSRRDVIFVGSDLTLSKALGDIKADLVISLGGDGTLLWIARHMQANQLPVLGVNLGKMGFLTEVTVAEARDAIEAFIEKRYTVTERLMLYSEIIRGGEKRAHYFALNDALVGREGTGRLIPVEVYVDGQPVVAYRGDGLLVSTPTGSTAYNLSAGGPIIPVEIDAVILTPVCPHSLASRPIVFPADERIEIRLGEGANGARFTVDGQESTPLARSDTVVITGSPYRFKLVSVKDTNRFDVIREKLHWRRPGQ